MKKLLIISVFLLIAGIAFGQTIQKGNLFGVHVLSIELKDGVTMDQYIKAFKEKAIPAYEKFDEDLKAFMLKGIRGENKNEIGFMIQFTDEAARDKYHNPDGSATELSKKRNEKLAPVISELEKLGTYTSKYTDWLIL